MTETERTAVDRTRLRIGATLIALVWLLSAATTIGLTLVLPDHHVRDYAWLIVSTGVVVAGFATYFLGMSLFSASEDDEFEGESWRLRRALERIALHAEFNAHFPRMSDLAAAAREALDGVDIAAEPYVAQDGD